MLDPADGYLVQIGFAGDCFFARPADPEDTSISFQARDRVLVQTPRGVELGTIVNAMKMPESTEAKMASDSRTASGLRILRRVTRDDAMLIGRLQKYKTEAVRRCQAVLAESQSDAVLLDVDHLFDGNTLVLHFLGPVDAIGRELTDEIVRQYESEVQSIRLSELMTNGCGPGCGTAAGGGSGGGGCGSAGGCETCSIACGAKT